MRKKILTLILVVVAGTNVHSQQAIDKNVRQKTVICGIIDNNWKEDSVKFIVKDFLPFATDSTKNGDLYRTVSCDSGKFKFTFYIDHPVYAAPEYEIWALIPIYQTFGIKSTRYNCVGMLIEPGDSIFIDHLKKGVVNNYGYKIFDDGSYFTEQTYSGRGAEKLWCIQNIIKNTRLISFPIIADNTPEEFNRLLRFSDSTTLMVLNTITLYQSKLTPIATAIIKANYIPMLAYDISELVFMQNLDITDEKIRRTFYHRMAQANSVVNLNTPGAEYSFYYNSIVRDRALLQYVIDSGLSLKEVRMVNSKFNFQLYNALKQYIPNSPIKERIIGSYVLNGLKQSGWNNERSEIVKSYLSTADKRLKVYSQIDEFSKKLEAKIGSNAFDFALPDTNNQIIRLNQFKGKLVLIDFMFTGCPGCIKMVPALTKVEEQFKGRDDIIFISISTSPDISGSSGWRAGIGIFSVAGSVQLCAGGKVRGDEGYVMLANAYNINAYPQLVLIDKAGKIITTSAQRPDSDEGKMLMKLIHDNL